MSNAPKIKVTFEAMRGASEQIGWLHAAGLASIPGLSINYFPVFRSPETGSIIRLLALGAAPGARHAGIGFDSDEHGRRFFEPLQAALR
jgi:hypothetical protein